MLADEAVLSKALYPLDGFIDQTGNIHLARAVHRTPCHVIICENNIPTSTANDSTDPNSSNPTDSSLFSPPRYPSSSSRSSPQLYTILSVYHALSSSQDDDGLGGDDGCFLPLPL